MNYKTVVIDIDNDALCRNAADLYVRVDSDDFERTIQVAVDNQVKGIITSATDKPILMMCRCAKELNLPFPSYESCETVLNKTKFKQFLKDNNFPHAWGEEYIGNVDISSVNLSFPVIIKPVMNSGSRGVIKCDKAEDLQKTIEETLQFCKDNRFLIEEFIEGDEISTEVLVQNGKVHLLQITDKILTPPPYNVELGHIQPSKFEYLKSQIEELIQVIVDKSGLNNCALHPEIKISGDKITIIEIGPRLGGDFITSHLVTLSTGINIEDQLINIAVGKPIYYKFEKKASLIYFLNFPVGKKVIRTISEDEMKGKFPVIVKFSLNLNVGEEIRQITNSLNRYGQFILVGENVQSLLTQKEEIVKFLEKTIINH